MNRRITASPLLPKRFGADKPPADITTEMRFTGKDAYRLFGDGGIQ